VTHRSIAIGKSRNGLPAFGRPSARWGWRVLLIATTCLSAQAVAFAQTASQITPPSFRPPPQANTAGVSIPEASFLEAPAGPGKPRVKPADVRVESGLPERGRAPPRWLDHGATFLYSEVGKATTPVTSITGPVLILFMGVVVRGLLLAIYMPLFNASSMVR